MGRTVARILYGSSDTRCFSTLIIDLGMPGPGAAPCGEEWRRAFLMKVERPRSCRPPRYKVSPPGGVSLRSPHTPSPLTPPPPYPHPHDVSGTEGVRQDDDRLPAELLRGGQQGQDPQPLPRQLPGGGRAAAAWPPPRANQTSASQTSDSNFRPQLGLAPVQPMASMLQKKL